MSGGLAFFTGHCPWAVSGRVWQKVRAAVAVWAGYTALKYAVKIDLIDKNESDKAELPKMEKFEGSYYTKEELMDLFDLFKKDRLFLVISIAVYYGFRRSEVVGLKWDIIDFENKTISVKRKAQETKVEGELKVKIVKDLKNKSSYRTLPLIPEIEELLLEKKRRNAMYAELLGRGYNHDNDDLICTDDLGNMITPRYVTDHFRYMIKKNGMKKIRFHDLRHINPPFSHISKTTLLRQFSPALNGYVYRLIISRFGKHRFARRKAPARDEESSKSHKESNNSPKESTSCIIESEAQPQF